MAGNNNARLLEDARVQLIGNHQEYNGLLEDDTLNFFMKIVHQHDTEFFPHQEIWKAIPVHLHNAQVCPPSKKLVLISATQMRTSNIDIISHYICIYYDGTSLHIYDSNNTFDLTQIQIDFINQIFPYFPKRFFHVVQKQPNVVDCGVFAAAFAASIVFGRNPCIEVYEDGVRMRNHLYNILQENLLQRFPSTETIRCSITPPVLKQPQLRLRLPECFVDLSEFSTMDVASTSKNKGGRPKKIKRGRPKQSDLSIDDQNKIARKKYITANPDKVKDGKIQARQNHPESQRDAISRYTQENPETVRKAKNTYEDVHRPNRNLSKRIRRSIPAGCIEIIEPSENECIPVNRRSTCIADKSGAELDSVNKIELKTVLLEKGKKCDKCGALLFIEEAKRKKWCCGDGAFNFALPPLNAQYYKNNNFLKNARAYNNMFAFSALGTTHGFKVPAGRGTSFVKVQGRIYHRVFDLSYNRTRNNTALYIDDGEERLRTNTNINLQQNIITSIFQHLKDVNTVINQLQILSRHPSDEAHIVFQKTTRQRDGPILGDRPVSHEIAALIRTDFEKNPRQVVVWKIGAQKPHTVSYLSESYEPLQYPMIFPEASSGWSLDLKKDYPTCSQIKYYRYRWLSDSRFGLLRRLSQEYIVDMWCRAEEERLQWIKHNQSKILRVSTWRQISEATVAGGNISVGKIYLPASHTNSPRNMLHKYLNAMAVVSRLGKPSFFLTVTCNPNWIEIKRNLLRGQTATDRPDICVRVFQIKLSILLKMIQSGELFGGLVSIQYVIEFQKRGLPHAHIAFRVIGGGPVNSVDIDSFVRATIPSETEAGGRLRELVRQHMVHGPCGIENLECPCMDKENNLCTKHFPKPLTEVTYTDDQGFVNYKRPFTDDYLILKNGKRVNNQWIVPYCPAILLLMECHCNLEIATSSKVIKYLYKYIHKGPDRARASIVENLNADDEIENYINFRYVSASEALWRIFENNLSLCYPTVISLPIHLPDEQTVVFAPGNELNALNRTTFTKLITYFNRPKTPEFENLSYLDFYEQYNVDTESRPNSLVPIIHHPDGRHFISKRQRNERVARVDFVSPHLGEVYFMRMLIIRVPCSGYEELRTVDSILYSTFQEACKARGLIDDDAEFVDALQEASTFKTGHQMRRLFFIIITNGGPAFILWDKFKNSLCEDLLPRYSNEEDAFDQGLREIGSMLRAHGRSLTDMGLPEVVDNTTELGREKLRWVKSDCDNFVRQWEPLLSREQKEVYKLVVDQVDMPDGACFFIDGPAGTGKTVLLNIITEKLRGNGHIVLCTATTGIAALNHRGGITAHSMFKLPLNIVDESAMWGISASTERAELIKEASLIILDEAPMAHKHLIRCLDLGLKDLMQNNLLFGGKIVLLAGDFRQIPPIIIGAPPSEVVSSSIRKSPLWNSFRVHNLVDSQRARLDADFAKFILSIGEGKAPEINVNGNNLVKLCRIGFESSIDSLIDFVFPSRVLSSPSDCCNRAILSGTNFSIAEINKKIINMLPGSNYHLYSADSSVITNRDGDQYLGTEILNTITQSGVPDHDLHLKINSIIILIRNLDLSSGLANGTKLIVKKITRVLIEVEKPNSSLRYFIPRVCFKFTVGRQGIEMYRRQFPIKLAYALTINKSQGQTLSSVGVDLRNDVFSHGQLYVALGRVGSSSSIRVLVPPERVINNIAHTVNVVYPGLVD